MAGRFIPEQVEKVALHYKKKNKNQATAPKKEKRSSLRLKRRSEGGSGDELDSDVNRSKRPNKGAAAGAGPELGNMLRGSSHDIIAKSEELECGVEIKVKTKIKNQNDMKETEELKIKTDNKD